MIRKKRKIAYILAFALGLTAFAGCSSKEEAPELLEPSFNNEAFRPVEKGLVGSQVVMMADIVPEDYPAFYTEQAVVEDISVDIGDYVEAGTVVAQMDTDELKSKRDSLNQEVSCLDKSHKYNNEIKGYEKEILKYKLKDAQVAGDKNECDNINTQIGVLDENLRYDEVLYKHQRSALSKEIEKLNEAISSSTLTAEHSGYVTYVKNLSDMRYAEPYESIVVISDTENTHLQLDVPENNSELDKLKKNGYDRMYIKTASGEVDIKRRTYANEALAVMYRTSQYPMACFDVDGNSSLALGEKMPIYFTKSTNKIALRVGTDSLYTEGTERFVYVKTDEGKEKRVVTVGEESKFYVEICDGLSEGELVYYSSNSIMPENYEELTIEATDYKPNNKSFDIRSFDYHTKSFSHRAEVDSEVSAVYVSDNDEVKKGDLLCTLTSKEGAAAALQMKKNLENMSAGMAEAEKAYAESLKEMDARINAERDRRNGVSNRELASANQIAATEDSDKPVDVSDLETESDAAPDDETGIDETPSATYLEQLCLEKEILIKSHELEKMNLQNSYNNESKNYDETVKKYGTNGTINIYAQCDGEVGNVYIYEGKSVKIEYDDELIQLYDASSLKYSFFPSGNDKLIYGDTVTLTSENGDTYQEKVIGSNGKEEVYQIAKKGDKYYSTFHRTDKAGLTFISHDSIPEGMSANDFTVMYSRANVSNVVVIPGSYLNSEVKNYNPEITYTYVWKLVDGNIVKQYVSYDEKFSGTDIWVLDGLTPGDVIIKEKVGE